MRKTFEQMAKCNCAVANTMAVIGGKWKILILYHLLKGEKRFNELSRTLGSVTPHTLSKELKELEQDGLVQRIDYQSIPPKVSYKLTDKGVELDNILLGMKLFGEKHPINWNGSTLSEKNDEIAN